MYEMQPVYNVILHETKQTLTEATMKSRFLLRLIGLLLMVVDIAAITYVYYVPSVLTGSLGVMFPVGLFIILLMAFYFLIMSTRH